MKYRIYIVFLFIVVALLLPGNGRDIAAHANLSYTYTTELSKELAVSEIYREANLYKVDSLVYRSEQLDKSHAQILTDLKIDAIINLRNWFRDKDKKSFAGSNIEFVNCPMIASFIKSEEVAAALWEIEQRTRHNKTVLVHCKHGADRTGMVMAMYRIVYQNWSLEKARKEMVDGPFGFHRIYRNLISMINEKSVKEVREELQKLRKIKS